MKGGINYGSKNRKRNGSCGVHIKEQAEETMDMLGIPVSCSVPSAPTARDELGDAAFHAMMERSLKGAKADQSRLASDVFTDLKRKMQ